MYVNLPYKARNVMRLLKLHTRRVLDRENLANACRGSYHIECM